MWEQVRRIKRRKRLEALTEPTLASVRPGTPCNLCGSPAGPLEPRKVGRTVFWICSDAVQCTGAESEL